MTYPFGRKGLTIGLEHELKRRKNQGERLFEYFAPTFFETKEVDGKLENTRTPLLFNYFFIRVSEDELFSFKRLQPQYNVLRRVTHSDGSYHYPYAQDSTIAMLQWIAKSYAGSLPLYLLDQTLLVKGDRIRITKGQFKGVEARIVSRPKAFEREVMVFVENWLCVPLMNVSADQYDIIDINDERKMANSAKGLDNARLSQQLHEALLRFHKGETTDEDMLLATRAYEQYSMVVVDSAIARCKLYAMLLPVCTILKNKEKLDGLMKIIHVMLPRITAEQSLALLMVSLYGCTDNFTYHEKAHLMVDPWTKEPSPKKNKQLLISRLADYDLCFGH